MSNSSKIEDTMGEPDYMLVDDGEKLELGPIRRFLQKTWVRVLVYLGLVGYGVFW